MVAVFDCIQCAMHVDVVAVDLVQAELVQERGNGLSEVPGSVEAREHFRHLAGQLAGGHQDDLE